MPGDSTHKYSSQGPQVPLYTDDLPFLEMFKLAVRRRSISLIIRWRQAGINVLNLVTPLTVAQTSA
jgi:hypothetical protein